MQSFTNKNTRSRIARAMVVCVAVALLLAALPSVFFQTAIKADAVAVGSAQALRNALAAGNDVQLTSNIALVANETSPVQGTDYYADITRFTLAQGKTVTIDMNGKNITWICRFQKNGSFSEHGWKIAKESTNYDNPGYLYTMFNNLGNLTFTGTGTIEILMDSEAMKCNADGRIYAANLTVIRNSGNLVVGNNVTLKSSCTYTYNDLGNGKYCDNQIATFGVYQTQGTCAMNGSINCYTMSRSTYTGYALGSHNSYNVAQAVGIYAKAGVVTSECYGVSSKITTEARTSFAHTTKEPDKSKLKSISIGVYTTAAQCSFKGLQLDIKAFYEDDKNETSGGSFKGNYHAQIVTYGFLYKDNAPTIGVGTNVNTTITRGYWDSGNTAPLIMDTAVGKTSTPLTENFKASDVATDFICNAVGENTILTRTNGAIFYDENGKTLQAGDRPTNDVRGQFPYNKMTGGAVHGSTQTHAKAIVIYRYWNEGYTSLLHYHFKVGTSGNQDDGFGYRNAAVVFTSGLQSNNLVNPTATFQYSSGGAVTNQYYWKLRSISTTAVTAATSGRPANYLTAKVADITRFSTGTTTQINGPTVAATAGTNIYMYVDYIALAPDQARVNLTTANAADDVREVTMNYTGASAIPGTDFPFRIFAENKTADLRADDTDITNRYNVVGNNTSLTSVTFTYGVQEGTYNASGLPAAAGTYYVRATVANDMTYTRSGANSPLTNSQNRQGTTYDFRLIINRKPVTITGPSSRNLTYGNNIGSLPTSGYTVSVSGNIQPTGTLSWAEHDRIVAPSGGSITTSLRWTPDPAYSANFAVTDIHVTIVPQKAQVSVTPKNKTIVYGEPLTLAFADFNVSGLVYGTTEYQNEFIQQLIPDITVEGAAYYRGLPAGTYNTYTGSGETDNYVVTFGTATLTVERRPLTVTAFASDREYNGTADVTVTFPTVDVTNVFSGDTVGTNDGIIINNVNGTVVAPVGGVPGDVGENLLVNFSAPTLGGAKAGNYIVANTNISNFGQLRINITKATPSVAAPALATKIYDSTKTLADHYAAADGVIAVSGTGETAGRWYWADSDSGLVPTVTNYGYRAVFVPTGNNYSNREMTIPVSITKRTITVSVSCDEIYYGDPAPVFSFAFAGFTDTNPASATAQFIEINGQQIDARGFSLGGSMPEITAYGGYTVGSNAGNYNISWTQGLVADNYQFVTDPACVLVVNKRTLNVQANNKTVTYGQNAPVYDARFSGFVLDDTANDITAQCGSVAFTCVYSPGTAVGSYPIVPGGLATHPNYNFNYLNGTLTVNRATLTVVADDKTVTYGSPVPALTYSFEGFVGSDTASVVTGTPTLTTDYSPTSNTDETYTISVNTAGMSSANYVIVGRGGIVTVNKAHCTVSQWPTASCVYEDTLAQAVLSGGNASVPGEFRFVNTSVVPDYYSSGTATYVISFVPTNPNYYTETGNITVTVTQRAISGTPTINGALMVGEDLTANVSTMTPNNAARYNYTWYVNGVQKGTGMTYSLVEADLDATIKLEVSAKPSTPYTGSAFITTIDTVTEALPKPTVNGLIVTIPQNEVYDRQTHEATVYATNPNYGTISVRYNGSLSRPVNAGSYVVTVDVSQGIGFGPVSGLVVGTLTIEKAPIYLSFLALDKVYDGRTNATIDRSTITTVGQISGDDVSLNTSAAMFYFEDANAGDGKNIIIRGAFLEGAQKNNYQVVINDITASITPKTAYVDAQALFRSYEPDNSYVDLVFTTPTGILTADRAYVAIQNGRGELSSNNAGVHSIIAITYDVVGDKAPNYEFVVNNEDSLETTITKAIPTAEIPTPAPITYSGTTTLAYVALGSNWAWNDASIIPQVNNSGYSATYTPNDTENYFTVSATIPLTVHRATATITVNNSRIVYGDPSPAFSVTASGFAGADSLGSCGGLLRYTTNYSQYSNAGSYTVSASGSSLFNSNYNFEYVDGTIVVDQKEVTYTPVAVSRGYIPGGTAASYQVTVRFTDFVGKARSSDDVSLSMTQTIGTISDPNAGTKSVEYTAPTLVGTARGNYTLTVLNPNIAVEITKIYPVNYTFPASATVPYGSSLAYATFSDAGAGDGTFAFVDQAAVPANVGQYHNTYLVVFTPSDYINYEKIERYVPLTVTVNNLGVAVALSGTLYVDQVITAVVSGMTTDAANYVHYSWYRLADNGAVTPIGDDANIYTLTNDDLGCRIRCDVTFDSPYGGEASVTSSRSVEEEKLNFWQRLQRWWYRILAAIQGLFDGVHR